MCELNSINNPPVTDHTNKKIHVIYHPEELHRKFLESVSATQERIDCCLDHGGLSFLVSDEQLWKEIIGLVNKGKRLRFITEITQENISYCNMLMKHTTEVFHDDNLKGNFLIVDRTKYGFYVVESQIEEEGQEGEEEERQRQKSAITQVIYSEDKAFVDSQQFLFDNLCNNASHARERIREIGRGIRGDFINTLLKFYEIQKTALDLLESSSFEVLALFSTINSFYRAEYSGILDSLWQASERGVMVKVLIQADDDNHQLREAIQKRIRQKHLPINIQYITKSLQNNITTLVIDQAVSLAIEVNDDGDSNKKLDESTATVAIFSNNESTVSSCISIFETLWIESEFEKQKKVKKAYFQMFKGLELKDEIYHSHMSFSEKTTNKEQKEEE
jgi:two-component system sensor histidine kinase VicK